LKETRPRALPQWVNEVRQNGTVGAFDGAKERLIPKALWRVSQLLQRVHDVAEMYEAGEATLCDRGVGGDVDRGRKP